MPRLKSGTPRKWCPRSRRSSASRTSWRCRGSRRIVLNMGMGEAIQNIKILDDAVEELAAIAGQRPTVTQAKKSIATFKLREGMPIGTRVTLRGDRMCEFLDRLINIALPRVRDFRGVPTQVLRRPRQLHPRHPRPPDLPGDRLQQGREAEGDEHHDRDDGRQRRARASSCASSACRSAALGGLRGDHCEDRQGREEAEVRGASAQPLQALRPPARVLRKFQLCRIHLRRLALGATSRA